MSKTFTRREFYDLVWSKPMTHLAKEFALSEVALHKICRKHGIPNPPPGWWAKKAAGKKVTQIPLPKPGKGVGDRILISGGELRNEPEEIAAAREQARILASAASMSEPRSSPIVERTMARLRKAKPGASGLVSLDTSGLVKCAVAPASIDRLEGVLAAVVATAAQQAF